MKYWSTNCQQLKLELKRDAKLLLFYLMQRTIIKALNFVYCSSTRIAGWLSSKLNRKSMSSVDMAILKEELTEAGCCFDYVKKAYDGRLLTSFSYRYCFRGNN